MCILLPPFQEYNVKLPNFTFNEAWTQHKDFPFPNLETGFWNFTPEKVANI